MSKRKKRLEKIRQNPNNVSLDDLRQLLEDYDFSYKQTVGSHHTFTYYLGGKRKVFVVPFKRPVKREYVKQAVRLIDQIILERGEDKADD